jgi:hypothetical protein
MSSLFPKGSAWYQEEERQKRFAALPPDVQRNSYTEGRPPGLHTAELRRESRDVISASREDLEFLAGRIEDAQELINAERPKSALTELAEAREVLRHYE